MKTALMENTKLNVSEINAILDEYYKDENINEAEKEDEKNLDY